MHPAPLAFISFAPVSPIIPPTTKYAAKQHRAIQLKRKYHRVINCSANDDKDKDNQNIDWDAEWVRRSGSLFEQRKTAKNFVSSQSKGEIQLPGDSTNPVQTKVDNRTERLTNFWSNDSLFLVAIGMIVLLIAFYSYIYLTGGIETHNAVSSTQNVPTVEYYIIE